MEILFEILVQLLLEVVGEVLIGFADFGAGGRRRLFAFAVSGVFGGLLSAFVLPQVLIADRWVRWGSIAGLTLLGGLVLAFFESRIRRSGPGSATSGFVSGVAFSLMYVLVRRWALG